MQHTLNAQISITAYHVTGSVETFTYTLTPDQCANEQRSIVVEAAMTFDALLCCELYNDKGYFVDGKASIQEGEQVTDALTRWDLLNMVGE